MDFNNQRFVCNKCRVIVSVKTIDYPMNWSLTLPQIEVLIRDQHLRVIARYNEFLKSMSGNSAAKMTQMTREAQIEKAWRNAYDFLNYEHFDHHHLAKILPTQRALSPAQWEYNLIGDNKILLSKKTYDQLATEYNWHNEIFPPPTILDILNSLMEKPNFQILGRNTIWKALFYGARAEEE